MFIFYGAQCTEWFALLRPSLLRVGLTLLRLFRPSGNGGVLQQLVRQLVCGYRLPLPVKVRNGECVDAAPFAPYHQHYPELSLQLNGADSRMADYHNDEGWISHLEFHRMQSHKILGALCAERCPFSLRRTRYGSTPAPTPSTLTRCKKYWNALCLHTPKTLLYLSVRTVINFSYQCASIALGRTPDVDRIAGNFYSPNYITVGA